MSIAVATTTKQDIGRAIAAKMGDLYLVTTTSAGNGGGTTAISTSLSGESDTYYINWWVLQVDGANAGQWRQCTAFTGSTGTLTVGRAFGAQVASGVILELHKYRPDLLHTIAPNEARFRAWQAKAVYKQEIDYVLAESLRAVYGVPRGMREVWRVSQANGGALLRDLFDRADSATTPGGSLTVRTGTWGIATEHLYSATDADGDAVDFDANTADIIFEWVMRGTLASSTVYRTIGGKFAILEDYTGAIDNQNYLYVRLLSTTGVASGGVVDLRVMDRGTEISLTTTALTTSDGVDYRIRVVKQGVLVRVFVDDIERITYRLDEPYLKFLDGKRVGLREDKAGAPATALRVAEIRVHSLQTGYTEHHDWQESPDNRVVEFGPRSRRNGLAAERYLKFEGGDLLTVLAADTTAGTIASYTTAVWEIETTDPTWDTLAEFGAWAMWEKAAMPGVGEVEDRANYREEAKAAEVRALRGSRMPRPRRCVQRPY